MTPIAAMVERMMSGGLSQDMIVLAVQTAEQHAESVTDNRRMSADVGGQSADSAMEKRRAYDRERQRMSRDKKKNASLLLTNSLNKEDIQERKEIKKDNSSKNQNRGTRLALDWVPSPADVLFSDARGVNALVEAEKFANYWHGLAGAKARKVDWPKTWQNWIIRASERVKVRAGPQTLKDIKQERHEHARQKLREFAYGPEDGGEGGRPVIQLFSADSGKRS